MDEESGALGSVSDGDIELPMADARLLVCAHGQQQEGDEEARALAVGDRVRVYWTYEREWYGGEVVECGVDAVGGEGCRIRYDDEAVIVHIMANERWLQEAVWQERETEGEAGERAGCGPWGGDDPAGGSCLTGGSGSACGACIQ